MCEPPGPSNFYYHDPHLCLLSGPAKATELHPSLKLVLPPPRQPTIRIASSSSAAREKQKQKQKRISRSLASAKSRSMNRRRIAADRAISQVPPGWPSRTLSVDVLALCKEPLLATRGSQALAPSLPSELVGARQVENFPLKLKHASLFSLKGTYPSIWVKYGYVISLSLVVFSPCRCYLEIL